jgi:trehalose 6-phosphate phosphatase
VGAAVRGDNPGAEPPPALPLDAVALFLDVDGTLLDIAPRPELVEVPDALLPTLERLNQQTKSALALVSGRPIADLDRIFAPARLSAAGGHGAELRFTPDGPIDRDPARLLDPSLKQRLTALGAGHSGVLVEDKGYSIALHFRQAPEKEGAIKDGVGDITAQLPAGEVEVLPGKAVVEIKRAGFTKGTAVQEFMAHPPFTGRQPVYAGDDVTDVAAIAALPPYSGIGIAIGRAIPGARYRLETPAELRDWLERLA